MVRRAVLSALLGLVLLTGSFVAFSTSDQNYAYGSEELPSVPEHARVFSFENLSEEDRGFVESGVGIGSHRNTPGKGGVEFPESRDPRDLLDFYSASEGIRGDNTVVRRNGSLYRIQRDSVIPFTLPFVLLPKYLLIASGCALLRPGFRETFGPTRGSPRLAALVGIVGFGLVEWFGNDWLWHLPSLAAGFAAVGLYYSSIEWRPGESSEKTRR